MAFKDTTERNAMNYYISDLHIGHENILRFDNRPFADVNEMNNKLIENWNARVRSDHGIHSWRFHLGKGKRVAVYCWFAWRQQGADTGQSRSQAIQRCHKAYVPRNYGLEGNQGQRQACCDVSLSDSFLPCQLRFDSVHALRACPSDD